MLGGFCSLGLSQWVIRPQGWAIACPMWSERWNSDPGHVLHHQDQVGRSGCLHQQCRTLPRVTHHWRWQWTVENYVGGKAIISLYCMHMCTCTCVCDMCMLYVHVTCVCDMYSMCFAWIHFLLPSRRAS